MLRRVSIAVMSVLLVGCTDPNRGQGVLAPDTVTLVPDLAGLPMADKSRLQTLVALTELSTPSVQRACTEEERKYLELTYILYTVRYDVWRTEPWSASQKAEVQSLLKEWEGLGAKARSLSAACQNAAARPLARLEAGLSDTGLRR